MSNQTIEIPTTNATNSVSDIRNLFSQQISQMHNRDVQPKRSYNSRVLKLPVPKAHGLKKPHGMSLDELVARRRSMIDNDPTTIVLENKVSEPIVDKVTTSAPVSTAIQPTTPVQVTPKKGKVSKAMTLEERIAEQKKKVEEDPNTIVTSNIENVPQTNEPVAAPVAPAAAPVVAPAAAPVSSSVPVRRIKKVSGSSFQEQIRALAANSEESEPVDAPVSDVSKEESQVFPTITRPKMPTRKASSRLSIPRPKSEETSSDDPEITEDAVLKLRDQIESELSKKSSSGKLTPTTTYRNSFSIDERIPLPSLVTNANNIPIVVAKEVDLKDIVFDDKPVKVGCFKRLKQCFSKKN